MPDFPGCDVPPPGRFKDSVSSNVEEDSPQHLDEEGVIPHHGPAHPHYASLSARINSYREWPPGLKQTPEMMAEAGLYYYGISDQVKCFSCDGGLKEWQEDDDPWVEHAGWFGHCAFVRLVRGDDFVRESQENVRNVVATRRGEKTTEQDYKKCVSCDNPLSTPEPGDRNDDEDLVRVNERLREQIQCKVCMDNEVGVVFLPCGHLVACTRCAAGLTKCAVCRKQITATVKVFMA